MSTIEDPRLKTEGIRFADLKKSKKSMSHLEEKQQDNTGVYTKELMEVGESKSWRALTLALARSFVSTTQKKKRSQ